MTKKLVYGVDPNGEITPKIVRDAIVKCFIEAYHEGMGKDVHADLEESDLMVVEIVVKAFNDTGGNFDDPTKEDVYSAIEALREFACKFRDKDLVQKHFEQISSLIEKLG